MTITPIERIILPPGDGRPDWLAAVVPESATPPGKDPYATYINRLGSEQSRRVMKSCLDNLARMIVKDATGTEPDPREINGAGCPWWLLRYQHTTRLRALLDSRTPPYSAPSINKHLSALRGVLEECWNLELMTGDDYSRAIRIKDKKFDRQQAGRLIHDDEMTTLLGVCSDGIIGIRDAALLATLRGTGIRCEEASTARIERYDGRERSMRVIGKGNKERTVYLHPAAVAYLERWLALLGDQRGPVFRTVDKHQRIGNRMSPGAIQRRISLRYQQAGLRKLSAHDFRRTFLSEFMDSGADAMQARKVAGHASVATTQLYDLREDRGIRDAVDRMKITIPAPPTEGAEGVQA
jgi:site-specific recombinase XerD